MRRLLPAALAAISIVIAGCGASSSPGPVHPAVTVGPAAVPVTSILAPCEAEPLPHNAKPCVKQSALRPDGYTPAAPPPVSPFSLIGSQIHLSHRGAELIEGFEGFSSCPYFDSAGGVPTRGFGETEGIRMSSACISRAFGERNLIFRAERFYGFAIKRLSTSFNQNEIDAQFSFLWNLGAGIDPPGSALAVGFQHHSCLGILAYDHAGGVVLSGLARRRRAECQRFHEPAHEETPAQHRARVRRERTGRLHADYRDRRKLDRVLAHERCLHGYRGFSRDHRRKCTKWRSRHARTNRDIKRLHRLGVR
jgi:GH24 family phage-related lysozyme (muramidase)